MPPVSAQSGNPPLDPHQLLAGLRDLESSEVQRKLVRVEGHLAYRYITDAGSLTLPRAVDVAAELNSSTSHQYLTGRYKNGRLAIGFSTLDQQALASGGGALLGAAICAIPGVGWAACALVGVIVSVATTYVVRNGVCSGGRTLWWYDTQGGSAIQCRSSAPF